MKRLIYIFSLGTIFLLTSCEVERVSNPRPHSYPRIEFPDRSYIQFEEDYCPITFEYPKRSVVNRKAFFFNDDPVHNCWFNLSLIELNATLYFTYQPINNSGEYEKLVDDAFTMVSKHNTKANSRQESRISNGSELDGVLFEIGGPVASPLQFYLSDQENHFIRASLYYNQSSSSDSLQIVTDYIKEDILHMIGSSSFL